MTQHSALGSTSLTAGSTQHSSTVIIDEESLNTTKLGLSTVGHVLGHLQRANRMVVRLLIDGEEPNISQIQTIKTTPLAGRTVFVETADPRATALDTLKQAERRLIEADRFKTEAADLFRSSQSDGALEKLGQCILRWQDAQRTITGVGQYFAVDLEKLVVNDRPVVQLFTEFANQLRDIQTALKSADMVGLTDLLEYETEATTANWCAALHTLEALISAAPSVQSTV